MSLLDPRVWLALILAFGGAYGLGYGLGRYHQYRADDITATAARQVAKEKAREREQQWQIDAQAAEEVHSEEVDRIAAERDRALASLRNRPARVSGAAPAASEVGTGASLYAEDADFLVRESSRADRVRADLARCEAWIESVTK